MIAKFLTFSALTLSLEPYPRASVLNLDDDDFVDFCHLCMNEFDDGYNSVELTSEMRKHIIQQVSALGDLENFVEFIED